MSDETCRLLWLNPRAWGKDLTSQLPWAAVWLLVTFGSPVYIVVADEFSTCLLWPLVIGIMVVLLTFFFHVNVVPLVGSWCYSREWVWNLRTKSRCIVPEKNVGESPLEGGETREILMTLPMKDGAIKNVESMWVNIWCMLDWIIGFCHKTAEIHFLGINCSTKECTRWLLLAGMKQAKIRTHCKA